MHAKNLGKQIYVCKPRQQIVSQTLKSVKLLLGDLLVNSKYEALDAAFEIQGYGLAWITMVQHVPAKNTIGMRWRSLGSV